MKILILIFLTPLIALSDGTSLLDTSVTISHFGEIKYRAPIVKNDKKPIVLFHGVYGGATHRTWRNLLPILDKLGQRVYLMDLPGVGESESPKRAYTIKDLDQFVETFLEEVVKERSTIVSESILSNGVLKVGANRPDLVRRIILLNPSGVSSLVEPPSERQQNLYDRLYNDDNAAIQFYQNLLRPSSLKFFLKFGFFNDGLINDDLLKDFLIVRDNLNQRFLTLSFVGGQLYRSFEVFVPVLAIFGKEYEAFQDNKISTAEDFKKIRPYFEYFEVEKSGSSVQRERPEVVAKKIIDFAVID